MAEQDVQADVQAFFDQEKLERIMEGDTSEAFAEVFGDKTEFDSWDEFTNLMEEFQKKSGSSFKLKSASCVDYINEKRVLDQIPDRFVYAKVKMICVHFGLPTIKGEAHRKNYVGKGCGAFINVGYNRGALRISSTHLVHTNHPLGHDNQNTPLRQFRVFNFTDEIDLIVAREVMRQNPFEFVNGDKKWLQAVNNLKSSDERLASITPRIVKKRIRLLVDKFLTISNGKPPIAEDEMGKILFHLDKTRKETLNGTAKRGRGQSTCKKNNTSHFDVDDYVDYEEVEDEDVERSSPVRRNAHDARRGRRSEGLRRVIKKKSWSSDYVKLENDGDDSAEEISSDHDRDPIFEVRRKGTASSTGKRRRGRPPKRKRISPEPEPVDEVSPARKRLKPANFTAELNTLVKYFHHRDEQERKLRQQEIDLHKEELALLKKELELQKHRHESDRVERKALLDYLQSQTQSYQNSLPNNNPHPHQHSHPHAHSHLTGTTGQVTEYTILVDNKQ